MAKWLPDSTLDLILDEIEKSDEEVILNAQPTTYFNCIYPDLWVASTVYVVGNCVRPPTDNNFIYECIVGGTSGGLEPGWSTVQDGEFVDGTVTWKAHENYAIANTALDPGDKVIGDGTPDGRRLTVAEKQGVVTHRAGTVSHGALIEHATTKLQHVTTTTTTIPGDNDVESGRTTIFFEMIVQVRDPS